MQFQNYNHEYCLLKSCIICIKGTVSRKYAGESSALNFSIALTVSFKQGKVFHLSQGKKYSPLKMKGILQEKINFIGKMLFFSYNKRKHCAVSDGKSL